MDVHIYYVICMIALNKSRPNVAAFCDPRLPRGRFQTPEVYGPEPRRKPRSGRDRFESLLGLLVRLFVQIQKYILWHSCLFFLIFKTLQKVYKKLDSTGSNIFQSVLFLLLAQLRGPSPFHWALQLLSGEDLLLEPGDRELAHAESVRGSILRFLRGNTGDDGFSF